LAVVFLKKTMADTNIFRLFLFLFGGYGLLWSFYLCFGLLSVGVDG